MRKRLRADLDHLPAHPLDLRFGAEHLRILAQRGRDRVIERKRLRRAAEGVPPQKPVRGGGAPLPRRRPKRGSRHQEEGEQPHAMHAHVFGGRGANGCISTRDSPPAGEIRRKKRANRLRFLRLHHPIPRLRRAGGDFRDEKGPFLLGTDA